MNALSTSPSDAAPLARACERWLAPRRACRSEYLTLRGVRHHLRCWGRPDAPLVVLLHGWMDMSATYQFMVDACEGDWNFVALDWAGYGQSEYRLGYSVLDYLADLNALLCALSPHEPVRIVAHSMAANIAMLYASAKPERVKALVNLEGLAPAPHETSPGKRMARWLDNQITPRPASRYASRADLALRLMKGNARLTQEQADFLAHEFGRPLDDGKVELALDPRAYYVVPTFPHREQILELWCEITAPVLFVMGEESFVTKTFQGSEDDLQERIKSVPIQRKLVIPAAGHNMHHDQAVALARATESFLATCHLLLLERNYFV